MKGAVIFLCGLMAGLLLQSTIPQWEVGGVGVLTAKVANAKVKRSLTGVCHPQESQFYNYVKYYIEYDNLTQCVLEGGRLPVRVKENVLNFHNNNPLDLGNLVAQ